MFSGGLEGRQSKLVISCNAGAAQPTFSALGETGAGTKIYVRWEMGEKGVEARRGEAREEMDERFLWRGRGGDGDIGEMMIAEERPSI